MRGLFLFFVCALTISACIGGDVDVDGWGCLRPEDCGAAKAYACVNNQCRIACQSSDGCGAKETCTLGGCVPGCEGSACGETTEPQSDGSPTESSADTSDLEPSPEPPQPEPPQPEPRRDAEPVKEAAPEPRQESRPETPCTPGATRSCFSGKPGEANVGTCKAGQQACGTDGWGKCVGEVTPAKELCDGLDNNCNGTIDDLPPDATCLSQDLTKRCLVGKLECTNGKERCVIPDPVSVTLVPEGPYASEGKLAPCTQAKFVLPFDVFLDSKGDLIVSDPGAHSIYRLTPQNKVELLAGGSGRFGMANGTKRVALFSSPQGLAIDAQDNLYVADRGNHCIRKITSAGIVTTAAGTCKGKGSADGDLLSARMHAPVGLALDGNILYVSDLGLHVIRKVDFSAGKVTTFAGAGAAGYQDGSAFQAKFNTPRGLVFNKTKTVLFVADSLNHLIRSVRLGDGAVQTLAGKVPPGGKGAYKDAQGSEAFFSEPSDLLLGPKGLFLLVADRTNHVIRRVALTNGSFTVLGYIGDRLKPGFRDGERRVARLKSPRGMAYDAKGQLVFIDTGNQLLRKMIPGDVIRTLAGRVGAAKAGPGQALCAQLAAPVGATLDPSGRLMVIDADAHTVFRIDPKAGTMTWASGSFAEGSKNGPTKSAEFRGPAAIIPARPTGFLVSELLGLRIRLINNSNVSDFAGDGMFGHGTGLDKLKVSFASPRGMAYDSKGNLYIVDGEKGNTIRVIYPNGSVGVFAGKSGVKGSGVGGVNQPMLTFPADIVISPQGDMYISDYDLHQIRKIDRNKMVSVLAGEPRGRAGSLDGKGGAARFDHPRGMWWSKAEHLLVADQQNHLIRRVTAHRRQPRWLSRRKLSSNGALQPCQCRRGPCGESLDHRAG